MRPRAPPDRGDPPLLWRRELKRLNPKMASITYDMQDLYNYIDRMPDMIAMVHDPQSGMYRPHTKEWIKEKCYNNLRRQVGA